MAEKPIKEQKLVNVLIEKFSDLGLIEKRKEGFFLTDQGRMLLANFGIDEKDIL